MANMMCDIKCNAVKSVRVRIVQNLKVRTDFSVIIVVKTKTNVLMLPDKSNCLIYRSTTGKLILALITHFL